jgi:uncharacterized protein YcfL
MKKLAIGLMLLAFLFIVGCQAPQDIKAQLDKQNETIMKLEKTVNEQAMKIEQLKMDFEKHLVDLHKQKAMTPAPKTPEPPTRVGR